MAPMSAARLALFALLFTAAVQAAPRASIDATIRGTDQPLGIELLIDGLTIMLIGRIHVTERSVS